MNDAHAIAREAFLAGMTWNGWLASPSRMTVPASSGTLIHLFMQFAQKYFNDLLKELELAQARGDDSKKQCTEKLRLALPRLPHKMQGTWFEAGVRCSDAIAVLDCGFVPRETTEKVLGELCRALSPLGLPATPELRDGICSALEDINEEALLRLFETIWSMRGTAP